MSRTPPDGFVAYCRQAHDAGEGGEDMVAIYKRIVSRPATETRRL